MYWGLHFHSKTILLLGTNPQWSGVLTRLDFRRNNVSSYFFHLGMCIALALGLSKHSFFRFDLSYWSFLSNFCFLNQAAVFFRYTILSSYFRPNINHCSSGPSYCLNSTMFPPHLSHLLICFITHTSFMICSLTQDSVSKYILGCNYMDFNIHVRRLLKKQLWDAHIYLPVL